jgi:hypothetical protein
MMMMEDSVGKIEVRNPTFSLYFSLLTGIHAETVSQQTASTASESADQRIAL